MNDLAGAFFALFCLSQVVVQLFPHRERSCHDCDGDLVNVQGSRLHLHPALPPTSSGLKESQLRHVDMSA